MSRIIVLALVVSSLSTIVGCGASTTRHSATPAGATNVASDDPWSPPGEFKMSFAETKKTTVAVPTVESQTERMTTSYRHNGNTRPTRGAVHAATY